MQKRTNPKGRQMFKSISCAMALAVVAPLAYANDFAPAMRGYVENEVVDWVADQVVIDAIRAQNVAHAALTQADIDAMDQKWRAEVGAAATPTIDTVLSGPAADFLRERQAASAGVISEMFIMDEHGLNVAASGTTSDYWQGDEAKFTESYAGKTHIGDVEFDQSTQSYLGQVSMPVKDPETGAIIGAITIGLNAEMLF